LRSEEPDDRRVFSSGNESRSSAGLLRRRKGVSFTRQYVARLVNEGKFPRPVRATDDGWHVAWLEHEIDAWIDARAAARDSEENT